MTGRERVAAALAGCQTDRVPFAPVLSLYGARLLGQDSKTYYTDPEAYLAGQEAVSNICGPDILFSPFALSVEGAAFGSVEIFLDRHPPNLTSYAVSTLNDLKRLVLPSVEKDPRLSYVRRSVRLMKERLGDRAMICGIVLSPIDSPIMLMGLDNWLNTVLFDRRAREAALSLTVPFFVEWANALLADGADFLALPIAFCNPNIVTCEMAEEFAIPVLREAFPRVKGGIVFHHVGATLEPFLHLLKDLPNVVGFALDRKDSFARAREIVGPGKVLLGNIDGPTLSAVSQEEAGKLAEDILKERAGDPLFFLATSSADVPWETPPGNILALKDAVDEAGRRRSDEKDPERFPVTVVSCSVFRSVLEGMDWGGPPPERIRYLDSSLHIRPELLEGILDSLLMYERARGRRLVVVYGDCAPRMEEICHTEGSRRISGVNCCQELLGVERYKELRRREAFVFFPEWTRRWRSLLENARGAKGETLKGMFREMCGEIVFADLGPEVSDGEKRAEIVEFFGLPFTEVKTDVAPFRERVRNLFRIARSGEGL